MKKLTETATRLLFMICACVSVLAVISICIFIFKNGIPAINEIGIKDFLLGKTWKPKQNLFGIFPMIISSIYVTAGAIIIGGPIGILTAIFLSCYCPKRLYKIIKPMINLLASVPSIIYGFFFLMTVVPIMQRITGTSGKGMLTASILLGLMILPTIINTSEASINAVPCQYFEGALALGATKEQSIFKTVLPAASSGVLSGIILGIGRAIGETMAVIMVAGNQARLPDSVLKGVRTLTANIVIEMGYATDLHRESLIATGVVRFVFILLINLSFNLVKNRGSK